MMLEAVDKQRLDGLAEAAEAYVRGAFGLGLGLQPLAPANLPHFLLDRYRFWQGALQDHPVILMEMKGQGRGVTADLLKHRDLVRRHLGVPLVLALLDSVPTAIRKQMVERKIGFLAPGAQIYVPEALLDLRERAPAITHDPGAQLTPSAQVLVLAALLGEPIDGANLTELALRFGVAIMTMTRALDELEALKIAKSKHVGRQRRLSLQYTGRELWHAVEARLQSPVRKVREVKGRLPDEVAPLAGESALAHYTMLSEPRIARRALAAARWKHITGQFGLAPATPFDHDRVEIETWSYDPHVLARQPAVDRLSLYLSVRHDPDERVAQAAAQLLETFEW
ncbi:hypothetical protein GL174_20120 (plasmid) [Sphingobium sp. CAP-1]|nr:hypothetical protein GL174_20120 [Sphingobium sp. CAP-1]